MPTHPDANLSQIYPYPTTPPYPTSPPQDDPANILAELIIYLFSIMCAENDTCSDVFELAFALVIAALSVGVAQIPVNSFRYEQDEQRFAKFAMSAFWLLSVVGGIYAGKKEYDHYLRDTSDPDSIDKLSAVASGALGGSVVTVAFTGMSAALVNVTTPRITHMFNRASTALGGQFTGNHYSRLQDTDPENPSRRSCLGLCGHR